MGDFRMEMIGDENVRRMFEELPKAAQDRVLKPLIRQGSAMIAAEEKAEAPTVTGLLKLALGTSPLRTYSTSLLVAVGVRRGFRRAVQGTNYRGGWASKTRYMSKKRTEENPTVPVQDPSKYLHLVIGGRKAISATKAKVLYDLRTGKFFGQHVAEQSPNDFIERAFERSQATVVQSLSSQIETAVLAEAKAILG